MNISSSSSQIENESVLKRKYGVSAFLVKYYVKIYFIDSKKFFHLEWR